VCSPLLDGVGIEAVADADVAYITVGITSSDLGTKLTAAEIGVVNTHPELLGVLKFAAFKQVFIDDQCAAICCQGNLQFLCYRQ